MFRPFQAAWDYILHWYLMYELSTCIYILDYPSKVAVNLFVLLITSIITYSSYVYLPSYVYTMLAFFNIIDASSDDIDSDFLAAGVGAQHASL